LSLCKSQLSKPLEEAAIVGQLSGLCEFDDWIYGVYNGQSVDLRPPLRPGAHRCAGEQQTYGEIPASHSITLSARATNVAGTVTPSP
jgi:hypothetical protein